MKKRLTLAGIFVLSLSLAACGRLNTRIEDKIEEVGRDLTGEPVQVEEVKIRIGGGSGRITGLTIPNPEGYEADNAFEMDLLRINVGVISLLSRPPIVLDELVIDSPTLNLEFNDRGGSNLKDIADTVEKNAKRSEGASQTSGDISDEKTRIAIRKLMIKDVAFSVRRVDGTVRFGTLPTIELTDVGRDDGATPAKLGATVIVAMAVEMLKQAVAHKLMEGFRFEGDRVLSFLDRRLGLTSAQRAEVKIVADEISQDLNAVMEAWIEEGFIDFSLLSEDMKPVADRTKSRLRDILDADQMQELQALLHGLDEEAVDAVRTVLAGRLADILMLDDAQKTQLRPILRQYLEEVGELLSDVAGNPDRSIEQFKSDYNTLQRVIRQQVQDLLRPEQLNALIKHQEGIREKIRTVLFPAG